MNISARLETIIDRISGYVLADIGTDHGYIVIEAVRRGKAARGIACDIKKGPLMRARANVAACGLEERIELRLGDGLSCITPGEADCISIAGVGGMLMREILGKGNDVLLAAERLVLQPQLDIPEIRRFVHRLGFKITEEKMLFEDKFYTVICCEHGTDVYYTHLDYAFGRLMLERGDPVLRQYLEKRCIRCEKILSNHESASIRQELSLCEEVLKCL